MVYEYPSVVLSYFFFLKVAVQSRGGAIGELQDRKKRSKPTADKTTSAGESERNAAPLCCCQRKTAAGSRAETKAFLGNKF